MLYCCNWDCTMENKNYFENKNFTKVHLFQKRLKIFIFKTSLFARKLNSLIDKNLFDSKVIMVINYAN